MTANRPDIAETLRRIQVGEYCAPKDWDVRRIPGVVKDLLNKYQLSGTCSPETPVNLDYELADTFFRAGYEMALRLGFYCTDTERIVRVSQEELDNALQYAPRELFIGEGKDGIWIKHRMPGDPYPLRVACPLGITVTEEYYPIILELIARERSVDILNGPTLVSIFGIESKSGTPIESLLCYEYAVIHRDVRRRAGRPGMAGMGNVSSVTEFGQLSSYGIPGTFKSTDIAKALFPSEHKIDYRTLFKIVHTVASGGILQCDSPSMIGGMPGPPEGAVVAAISCALLSFALLGSDISGGQIHDIRWLSNVNPEALWAQSTAQQALNRNTHLITHPIANQVSGPMTENLLYEIAAGNIALASSGAALTTTPRSAGGKLTNHITPLECRFVGEVAHAASGLDPRDANDIVNALIPRYIDTLREPDVGAPFNEAYDVAGRRPIKEWNDTYERVRTELIDLGVPIDEYETVA